jgi:hypothetical protein
MGRSPIDSAENGGWPTTKNGDLSRVKWLSSGKEKITMEHGNAFKI